MKLFSISLIILIIFIFGLIFFPGEENVAWAKLLPPLQISPCNKEVTSPAPTLKWNSVQGASRYQWHIEDILGNKVASGDTTQTTVPAGKLEGKLGLGKTYRWNVRTWDQKGIRGDPSPWCEFIIQTTPTAPITPTEGVPYIRRLNPPDAPVRMPLEIIGGNFDPDYSKNLINFNQKLYVLAGHEASVSPSGGDTSSLRVEIPFWLQPGNVAVKVLTGGKESNEAIFSVEAAIAGQTGDSQTQTGGNGRTGRTEFIKLPNFLNVDSVQDLIKAINWFVWRMAIAIAPIMFIIAGFMFITSGGDPGRVRTAKKLFLYTAIGLAVVLLASSLYEVLKSVLEG